MTGNLNAKELHDELLTVAGLEKNSGSAGTSGSAMEFIRKIIDDADLARELDAEQEILQARIREKRLELESRLAELTKFNATR
jgi:hypothetical protein